mgnify:CR=1 FL=1
MADNYVIQLKNAQKFFLTYDQEKLIRKFRLKADESFLYVTMFATPYRLCRHTGNLERFKEGWEDANTFGEVMTLLDILCDSREDRYLTGKWMSTQMFGKYFHSGLLEPEYDALADSFDKHPGSLEKAFRDLGGRSIKGGDEAWAVPVMDGLEIGIFFWHADEEFPAQLRYFWDENALMYIKYETMHYTLGYLRSLLKHSL